MAPVPNRGDLLCHCREQALLNALEREPVHAGALLNNLLSDLSTISRYSRGCRVRVQSVAWWGLLTVFGLLGSACQSSDQARSTPQLGPSWTRNLNETPPRREPAGQAGPQTKSH